MSLKRSPFFSLRPKPPQTLATFEDKLCKTQQAHSMPSSIWCMQRLAIFARLCRAGLQNSINPNNFFMVYVDTPGWFVYAADPSDVDVWQVRTAMGTSPLHFTVVPSVSLTLLEPAGIMCSLRVLICSGGSRSHSTPWLCWGNQADAPASMKPSSITFTLPAQAHCRLYP